jgi:hypothetical protein
MFGPSLQTGGRRRDNHIRQDLESDVSMPSNQLISKRWHNTATIKTTFQAGGFGMP